MNRGQHRRLDQPGVAQRHEIVVAVDQVELRRMLEGLRDVQVFGDLGIDGAIFLISLRRPRSAGGPA